ncbi:hypothetical protein F66182_6087 [Fusarium sp. NRRL 66182]|nr:hypothetical protein F66182_6087 [Fusarium sp. NRRL 66182]
MLNADALHSGKRHHALSADVASKRAPPGTSRPKPPHPSAVREGPYSHLNPADIQEAVENLEDASSPPSLTEGHSATTSPSSSATSSWVPFKIRSYDDDSIYKALRIITKERLRDAKHIYFDDRDTQRYLAFHEGRRPVARPVEGSIEQLKYLPMEYTKLNKELVRLHLQLLCRFKCAVDGNPDPRNQFMKYWITCSVQDPLLLQIVLFTSSCFLSETGHIPKTLAMMHKGKVYQMLNSQLGDESIHPSDSLVLGVVQMIADSWYWGATDDLKAHLLGLREMIRLRGGLSQLGLHGYLAKMILVHDISMALAHEIKPSMYGHPGYGFRDPFEVPFHTALNTPLISGWQPFQECSGSLQLHAGTAQILDDIRSLFHAVMSLPKHPAPEAVHKVTAAAGCMYDRIYELPENALSQQSPGSGTPSRSNSAESPAKTPGSVGSGKSSQAAEQPDLVYRVVRKVALIYCQAILHRSPISTFCSEQDVMVIWGSVWQASLARWKSLLGIFGWVMLAIAPSCHSTGPGRLIKTLTVSTMMSIGMDNWHIAMQITKTAFRLQRWLAGGKEDSKRGLMGGEKVVDKYGYVMKGMLPDIDLSADGD